MFENQTEMPVSFSDGHFEIEFVLSNCPNTMEAHTKQQNDPPLPHLNTARLKGGC